MIQQHNIKPIIIQEKETSITKPKTAKSKEKSKKPDKSN